MYYCEIFCIQMANNLTQAHEDEWGNDGGVRDSGVSSVLALLALIRRIQIANNFTQAHFNEWVKDSRVSSVLALLDLVCLDDPRVIVRLASQSTKAISEVL